VARNTRTLTFDLFAKNHTKKAFKDVGDDANKMGSVLGKVGVGVGIAFAAAAAGIIKVGVDAFESLKRIETIGAQTSAVIKSTGGAANVTAEQIRDLADALEKTTATESEAIQEGANLLLTFTNIRNGAGKNERVFDRATTLMVDYARAMGTDAKDGAIQLGKALNDPIAGISALGRAGVQFSDDQKGMIKSLVEAGDLMGAQTVILDELQTQFGGSGAAYAGTFAGQIDTLNNNLGNVAESIVIKLMPVLTEALEWMNGDGLAMLTQFSDWFVTEGVDAIDGFVARVRELSDQGTLVPAVVAGLAAVTGAQIGLNAAMALNPIGLVVLALAALVAQLAYVLVFWDDFKVKASDTSWGIPLMVMFTGWFGIIAAFAQNWDLIWFGLTLTVTQNINQIIGMINRMVTPLSVLVDTINFLTGSNFSIKIPYLAPPSVPTSLVRASSQAPANTSQMGRRTFMAAGGIVRPTPGGTAATIGEGGQAEAVIPLSASSLAKFGLGGGGGVTVVIQGSVLSDERKIATAVRNALKNQRGQGFSTQGAFV